MNPIRDAAVMEGPSRPKESILRLPAVLSLDSRRGRKPIPKKIRTRAHPRHFMNYASCTNIAPNHDTLRRVGLMEFTFTTGTAFAVVALVAIVAIYFLWVRKLSKKPESTEKVG
jgi:hypothetical protein